MAEECKLTIVGRFLKPRPQIEKIRSVFKELFPIKGSAKIGVYDTFNVFIDFTNEDDFCKVWFRSVIEIEGSQMWLQKWSPDFKHDEALLIAPMWILLPEIPFHMHTWQYMRQIVASIGIPLGLDVATTDKTRPSLAKVCVEVNLLKKLPDQIWVGLEDEGIPLKGYYHKIEYENILKYYKHCKKLGHNVMNCRVLERIKANEAKEIERNAINLDDNGKQNTEELESSNIKEKNAENIKIIEENKNVGKDNEADNGQIGLTVAERLNNNKKKKKGEKKKAEKKKNIILFNPALEQITGNKRKKKKEKKELKFSRSIVEESDLNINKVEDTEIESNKKEVTCSNVSCYKEEKLHYNNEVETNSQASRNNYSVQQEEEKISKNGIDKEVETTKVSEEDNDILESMN
ncbi:hypothetical protein H5410_051210 [Solanum commersonii]|uniref:DUF4283 domain-containing protein n=1 Tax=Solanum commersonii TaxID=4109 RepID=A0A9J5WYX9_SOLCO|nr:hypothetical protein H5410_051210 [Solanum commersonii]